MTRYEYDPVDAGARLVRAEPLAVAPFRRKAVFRDLLRDELEYHRVGLRRHAAVHLALENAEDFLAALRPIRRARDLAPVGEYERVGNLVVLAEHSRLRLVVVDFDKAGFVRPEPDRILLDGSPLDSLHLHWHHERTLLFRHPRRRWRGGFAADNDADRPEDSRRLELVGNRRTRMYRRQKRPAALGFRLAARNAPVVYRRASDSFFRRQEAVADESVVPVVRVADFDFILAGANGARDVGLPRRAPHDTTVDTVDEDMRESSGHLSK